MALLRATLFNWTIASSTSACGCTILTQLAPLALYPPTESLNLCGAHSRQNRHSDFYDLFQISMHL
jgi:hypothetical protein